MTSRFATALASTFATLSLLVTTGCTAAKPPAPHVPSQAEWTRARDHLSELRASEPTRPYVAELRVALRERLTGRGFDARGALAVDPHRALRLILLGPGGTTAVDLWVTRARFRLRVPSFDYVRRGGTDRASMAGLPIAFFRAFFLEPLEGKLLTARMGEATRELVLRNDQGTFDLLEKRPPNAPLTAILRAAEEPEARIEWWGRSFRPHAGDVAHYVETSPGLDVAVRIDEIGSNEPEAEAFVDPDVAEVSL